MRPGEGARVFGGVEDLLEVVDGGAGLALHQVDAGEDVVGAGMVAVGVGEHLVGDLGGAVEVTFEDLHLGELQAGELRRRDGGGRRGCPRAERRSAGPCGARGRRPCRRPSGPCRP